LDNAQFSTPLFNSDYGAKREKEAKKEERNESEIPHRHDNG
jgi:hypothetical protein